jgi:hypothetical protein
MDLLHERYERFVEEIAAELAVKASSPALKRLDSVLTKIIALLEENAAMLGPVTGTDMRDVQCNASDISRHIPYERSPLYLWLHGLLTRLLTEAVERKELAPLDIPYTADSILSTFHPQSYRFQRQARGFSSERILQGLRHIYIDGLKASSSKNEIAGTKTTT